MNMKQDKWKELPQIAIFHAQKSGIAYFCHDFPLQTLYSSLMAK